MRRLSNKADPSEVQGRVHGSMASAVGRMSLYTSNSGMHTIYNSYVQYSVKKQ